MQRDALMLSQLLGFPVSSRLVDSSIKNLLVGLDQDSATHRSPFSLAVELFQCDEHELRDVLPALQAGATKHVQNITLQLICICSHHRHLLA